jgi:hypothetical protein
MDQANLPGKPQLMPGSSRRVNHLIQSESDMMTIELANYRMVSRSYARFGKLGNPSFLEGT